MLKNTLFDKFCMFQRWAGIALMPRHIIWEPTFRCCYRCSFCGFYGPGGATPNISKEMSLGEIKTMWKKIQKEYPFVSYYVSITGGEPLARPDFIEIIKILRECQFIYGITTNGYLLTEKIADEIKNCVKVNISLHGLKDMHDKTVNVPGAFDKVTANIKMLKEKGIDVMINCVITNENIDELQKMKELADELGTGIRFQHLEFLSPETAAAHCKFMTDKLGGAYPVKYGTYKLTDESIVKAKKFIEDNPNQVYEPDGIDVDKYYNDPNWSRKPHCLFPWGVARIDPYGNVYPCVDYVYGNLKEQTLRQIWKGEKAKKFRSLLKQCKLFPGCKRCCKL